MPEAVRGRLSTHRRAPGRSAGWSQQHPRHGLEKPPTDIQASEPGMFPEGLSRKFLVYIADYIISPLSARLCSSTQVNDGLCGLPLALLRRRWTWCIR